MGGFAVVGLLSILGPLRRDEATTSRHPADPRIRIGAGEFAYWKTVHVGPHWKATVETWWSEDGSGRIRAQSISGGYAAPRDQTWGPGQFVRVVRHAIDLSGLSTDPGVLTQQLLERSAPGGSSPQPAVTLVPGASTEASVLWRAVEALVAMPNATPELRAALFEVAARLEGIVRDDGARDPVGRPAVALSFSSDQDAYTMFFDASTRLHLATVISGSGACTPECVETETRYDIVTAGGIVRSRRETPSEPEMFFLGPQKPVPKAGSTSHP